MDGFIVTERNFSNFLFSSRIQESYMYRKYSSTREYWCKCHLCYIAHLAKHLEKILEGGVVCGLGNERQGIVGQKLRDMAQRGSPSLQVLLEESNPLLKLRPVLETNLILQWMALF